MKPWKLKRTRRFKNKGKMLFNLIGIGLAIALVSISAFMIWQNKTVENKSPVVNRRN